MTPTASRRGATTPIAAIVVVVAIAIAIASAFAREHARGGADDADVVRAAFVTLRAPLTCDVRAIQRRFRARALEVHPDKVSRGGGAGGGGDDGDADAAFANVAEAYATARRACRGHSYPHARRGRGVVDRAREVIGDALRAIARWWRRTRARLGARAKRARAPRQLSRDVLNADKEEDAVRDASGVDQRAFWRHVMDTLDVPYDDDDDDENDDENENDDDDEPEPYPFASRAE